MRELQGHPNSIAAPNVRVAKPTTFSLFLFGTRCELTRKDVHGQKQSLKSINSNGVSNALVVKPEDLVRAHPVAVQSVGPRPWPPKSYAHLARFLTRSMKGQLALSHDSAERVGTEGGAVRNALGHALLSPGEHRDSDRWTYRATAGASTGRHAARATQEAPMRLPKIHAPTVLQMA